MQNTNFEAYMFQNGTIEACYLNVTLGFPCMQGSIPPIGVDVRTVGMPRLQSSFPVKRIFDSLLRTQDMTISVGALREGGSYSGPTISRTRNTTQGLSRKELHRARCSKVGIEHYRSDKQSICSYSISAVTFGAGVQWNEAYDFVDQQGRFVVGGISVGGSVGSAGGWVMGGGHSAFSPSLGLGKFNTIVKGIQF